MASSTCSDNYATVKVTCHKCLKVTSKKVPATRVASVVSCYYCGANLIWQRTLMALVCCLALASPLRAQAPIHDAIAKVQWTDPDVRQLEVNRRTFRPVAILVTSYVVLSAADIATSMYAFGEAKAGGRPFHEANPLLRPLQDNPVGFAVAKTSIVAATSYLMLKLNKRHPKATLAMAIGANALMTIAIVNNQKQID